MLKVITVVIFIATSISSFAQTSLTYNFTDNVSVVITKNKNSRLFEIYKDNQFEYSYDSIPMSIKHMLENRDDEELTGAKWGGALACGAGALITFASGGALFTAMGLCAGFGLTGSVGGAIFGGIVDLVDPAEISQEQKLALSATILVMNILDERTSGSLQFDKDSTQFLHNLDVAMDALKIERNR